MSIASLNNLKLFNSNCDRVKLTNNKLTILLTISIITLSLSVIRIFNIYSLSLASFFCVVYIREISKKIDIVDLCFFLSIICFLFFNAAIDIFWIDEVHFLRSILLTAVFLFCYISSLSKNVDSIFRLNFKLILIYSVVPIVAFEFLQIFEQLYFGTTSLWFLFDGISISTADDIGRFEAVNLLGFSRPISFYHEPSYLGAVLMVLYGVNDNKVGNKFISILISVAILLTISSTVMVFFFFYVIADYINSHRRFSLFMVLCGILVLMIMQIDIFSLLRFDEVFTVGTSGWFRIMFPLIETFNYLERHPLGIPLAQAEFIYDNSLFLILVYFGVLTPFLIIGWLYFIKRKIRVEILYVKYIIIFFCLLFLNGAIFTFESAALLVLLNISFKD